MAEESHAEYEFGPATVIEGRDLPYLVKNDFHG